MAHPSDNTKNSVSKMSLGGIGKSLLGGAKRFAKWNLNYKTGGLFNVDSSSELVDKNNMPPAKVLGEIYKMMKIMEEDKRLNHELAQSTLESEELKKDLRNKEIIKALTGRRKKKPVTPRKRKAKKEEVPTVPTGRRGKTPETSKAPNKGKMPDKGKAPDKGKEPDKTTNKADEAKRNADAKKVEADRKTKEAKDAADAKKAENDRAAQERATKREKEEQAKAAARQKQLEKEKKDAADAKTAADKKAGEAQSEAEKRAASRAQEEANRKVAEAERKTAEEAKVRAKTEAERKAAEAERKRLAEEKKKKLEEEATAKRLKDEEAKKTAEKIKAEKEAAAKKSAEEAKRTATKSKPDVSTAEKIGTGVAIATTAALTGKEALAANIAKYESKGSSGKSFGGNEYNAYNKGTSGNKIIGADKPIDFSKMTIQEYFNRAAKTKQFPQGNPNLKPGDPETLFAVGRYQIIPPTMLNLVQKLKLDPKTTYLDSTTQDLLFAKGLTTSIGGRAAVDDYIKGKPGVTRDAAIMALAKEFASVGVPYDTERIIPSHKNEDGKLISEKRIPIKKGQSYYSGLGGNKAHNSPEEVGAALDADRAKHLKLSPTSQNVGNQIDQSSKENAQMKKELNDKNQNSPGGTNTTVINQQNNSPAKNTETEDDTPVFFRKLFN